MSQCVPVGCLGPKATIDWYQNSEDRRKIDHHQLSEEGSERIDTALWPAKMTTKAEQTLELIIREKMMREQEGLADSDQDFFEEKKKRTHQ